MHVSTTAFACMDACMHTQGGPAWLLPLFGVEKNRTVKRLDAAKQSLMTPGEKHKIEDIRQARERDPSEAAL